MEDWLKVAIAGFIALVTLLLGGGAMGKLVSSVLKTLVDAIIAQNSKLTLAIERNTTETSKLTSSIQHDIEMQKLYNREREKQLDRLETHAIASATQAKAASDASAALVEKLKGRI